MERSWACWEKTIGGGESRCLRPQCTEGGEDGGSLWQVMAGCLRRVINVQNLLGEQLITTAKK